MRFVSVGTRARLDRRTKTLGLAVRLKNQTLLSVISPTMHHFHAWLISYLY